MRVGTRQTVCSSERCQKERHRRNCAEWHRSNPDYDREARLRARVTRPAEEPVPDPLVRIDWSEARDLVGLEVAVIVEETAKVLVAAARDERRAQAIGITREIVRHPGAAARDEMAERVRGGVMPSAP